MKTRYLAVAAVVVATGSAVVWQAASTPLSAPINAPSVQTVAVENEPVLDGVLRPSEFPGVETVSIPDAPVSKAPAKPIQKAQAVKKSVDGKAWVRVLPGGKIPEGGYSARATTTWRRENGKTPLGGIALIPDQSPLLHEVARRDKNGVLIHECAPDESAAQHAKHKNANNTKPKN